MSGIKSIDTNELVASKENIQPLRHGRDTSILCAALQAENDAELQQELEKQRNEFEIKLRSSVGNDPLKDWCAYTHWIEQSFPRQGREGKLNVVLRKCINKFKDCENYKNDIRFVKLCIKYADMEENTVELLSQMHRHGIGVSCAELYITWADKYAVDNCFKKANAIYERGLQCQAKPLEFLKEAHQNFQAFLVRKMVNEGEIFQPTVLDSNPTETRVAYNILQSMSNGRKEVVPSVRIGQNVLGAAGKLQQINKEPKLKSNRIIKVYEDSENSCEQPEPKRKLEKVPSKKAMTKENTMKPGPWINKQNKHVPFKLESSSSLPFQVHRDEENVESEKNVKSVPFSVLKSHKIKSSYEDDNFDNAPLFYQEPYDPTKVSMYCKEQVYAGGLEFQFEELRAMQSRRKREEIIMKRMTSLKLAHGPKLEEIAVTLSTSKSKSERKSDESSDRIKLATIESRGKSVFNNPLPKQNENSKTDYIPEQENLPTTDYSMNQTIHTKEALSEMQQLWFSKPPSPVPLVAKPVKTAAKAILKPSKPCFSLYVDESCLENLKTLENPVKPLDLTMKLESQSDSGDLNPPSGVRKKTGLGEKIKPPIENSKENVFFREPDQLKKLISEAEKDDEDKENGVPSDYCGPVGKSIRKVSGILTPAANVEIAPLSDEEVEEDEDEDVQNYSSIIQCNATEITETWNFTKGFQFPRGESTPNIRKSILKKENCNDSVFVPEQKNDRRRDPIAETVEKLGEINEKTIILQSGIKKTDPIDGNTFTKNLSVIAESSREYRSSSSGSTGASSLPLRLSKCFSHTAIETKTQREIDPFNDELLENLLKEVGFPKDNHWNGYFLLKDSCMAVPRVGSTISLGAENFEVKKILGEGSYARIFKLHNPRSGELIIGKFQKPAFPWEFYITREVHTRIQDKSLTHYFVNVESAYFFKNSSILLSRPVEFGDLLSVINKMKQAQMISQILAIYFVCQILKIVETLHSCKIIHGDVKPDNFLLRNYNGKFQLQLIDFGRSIDMSLFPEGTTFRKVVTTEGFTTIEMRIGKPWTYQIDLFGIANCGHCLLFGEYMKVVEKGGIWNISKIIHRYWARSEWKNFFVNLINVESCTKLPSLSELREAFEAVLEDRSEIEYSLFKLKNLL